MSLVPAAVSMRLGRKALALQRVSPNLLFGVGVVGVVGGTVLACRATLKMEVVLSEGQEKMNKIRMFNDPMYTEKDRDHDLTLARFQTGAAVVRTYVPAVAVTGLSIVALTSSHRMLTNRNTALIAAYTALDEGFKRYRARVVDKYGEEQDQEFYYDTEKVQIKDPTTNRKKTVTRIAPEGGSVYARFFDQFNTNWHESPESNLIFLKCQQNYANELLRVRGHVFLNEVYDALGMERSKAGAVVGWVLSDKGDTDNYISFGVFEGQTENARDFVNAREGAVLCDFNVDGVILNKFERLPEELSWQLGH